MELSASTERPPTGRPGGLTLVTGGARSGKSLHAQQLAESHGGSVLFVATAESLDGEMHQRIAAHRASRPDSWQTLEAPVGVGAALAATASRPALVLLDCITLLVSNLLLRELPVLPEIEAVLAWHQSTMTALMAVTNEVGLGIVPDNPLARQYRDELGRANQLLAAAADSVILMVAGIPVTIKGQAGGSTSFR